MLKHENDINDELLIQHLLKELDYHRTQQVEIWIKASPENERYYLQFKKIWDTSHSISVPDEVNEEEAWLRFQQRVTSASAQKAVVIPFFRLKTFLKVAAMLVVIAGASLFVYLNWFYKEGNPVLISAVAEAVTDTLPDGSVITLNKHSSISYANGFNNKTRKLKLEGEAFFSVKPNKNKPFIVEQQGIVVTVLGTAFNIKTLETETEVIVESGVVQVTKAGNSIILQAGEKLVVSSTGNKLVKEKNTGNLYNYYRSREFVCDETPLWKLVQVLNEAYDVQIIIQRKELRQLMLTTTFSNESLDNILTIIAETFDVTVVKENNRIIIK